HLEVTDPTGNKVYDVPSLSLNAFGSYAGEFTLSKQAAVGWYEFHLTGNFGPHPSSDQPQEAVVSLSPMRVLVSDFTPAPFKVTNQVNGDLFKADQSVDVSSQATLHSGGPYSDASVRVTAVLESKPFVSHNPLAQSFTFDSAQEPSDTE